MTDDVLELDDVAARALASIILEHTAGMLSGEPDAIGGALRQLADDAAIVPDVAAAILTATSWLVGAGQVAPEAIYAASLALQPDEATETATEGAAAPVTSAAGSGGVQTPEPAAVPQLPQEGAIVGDGGGPEPDFAAMAAANIAAAQAALDAPGATDAPAS